MACFYISFKPNYRKNDALPKVDLMEDKERLELVELEIRELLNSYGFPGDSTPIVAGSALLALDGKESKLGEQSVLKLSLTMDEYIPKPKRDKDKPFLLPIEDVFSISGRGAVVTGRQRAYASVAE